MFNRIRQFYSAITAAVNENETDFVLSNLLPPERDLFYEMSIVDQRHALDVSYKVMESLQSRGYRVNSPEMKQLLKVALLHDVGKRAGDLNLLDRAIIVIMSQFCPGRIEIWALHGKGGFIQNRRHAFYVAVNHGELGAEKLQQIGCDEEIVNLVLQHHVTETDDWRIIILKDADQRS